MDRESLDNDYDQNPGDERIVDLADDTEPEAPLPTLDPDERIEDTDEDVAFRDDDRDAGPTG